MTDRTCASASWIATTIPPAAWERCRPSKQAEKKHEVLTGVLYVNTEKPNFLEMLHLAEEPLATLPQSKVRPPKAALDEVMEELR